MAVKMDRMTIHAEVAETEPHAVALLHDQRIGPRPDAAVEREEVEVES